MLEKNEIFKKNFDLIVYEYPELADKINSCVKSSATIPDDKKTTEPPTKPSLDEVSGKDFIVLMGLGSDDFIVKLRNEVLCSTTILVVEKDLRKFIRLISEYDVTGIIEGWQIKFLIDLDLEEFDQYLHQYYFPIHNLLIIKSYHNSEKSYYENIETKIDNLPALRKQKSPPEKTFNFLMMVGRRGVGWPYIMQDVIATLHKLGHSVRLLHLERGNLKYEFREEIKHHRPDYIFMLDAIGLMREEIVSTGIPHISWFFDNPFNWLKTEHVSEDYYIFVWDKTYVQELKDMGFTNVHYMPLAANPDIFFHQKADSIPECDVSFAGSSLWSDENPPFKEEAKKAYIKLLSDSLCKAPWISLWKIIDKINKQFKINFRLDNPEGKREFEMFIQSYARTGYRNSFISAILDFDPHLYGDAGWLSVVKKGKGIYKGRINNRINLPALYSGSAINLNITVPQIRNSFSHRAFEIPACGGFLLSDYRPEAENFFEIGKEIVCFKNVKELKDKTRYFIDHPKERKAIAERGRKRVLDEHTYKHRLKKIIKIIA